LNAAIATAEYCHGASGNRAVRHARVRVGLPESEVWEVLACFPPIEIQDRKRPFASESAAGDHHIIGVFLRVVPESHSPGRAIQVDEVDVALDPGEQMFLGSDGIIECSSPNFGEILGTSFQICR
jgi:hypothetical protein